MDKNSSHRSIFRRMFIIPFGRYRRHTSGSAHESLFVGREGSTNYLIDALSSNAKRGAYLITGRRGVGKSTFVDRCVAEAEELRFRRYMRRSAGRTPVDLFTMGVFALCVIAFFAADFEISELQKQEQYGVSNLILGLLIVPTLALVVYAWSCIWVALKSIGYQRLDFLIVVSLGVLIIGFVAINYFGPLFAGSVLIIALLLVFNTGLGTGYLLNLLESPSADFNGSQKKSRWRVSPCRFIRERPALDRLYGALCNALSKRLPFCLLLLVIAIVVAYVLLRCATGDLHYSMGSAHYVDIGVFSASTLFVVAYCVLLFVEYWVLVNARSGLPAAAKAWAKPRLEKLANVCPAVVFKIASCAALGLFNVIVFWYVIHQYHHSGSGLPGNLAELVEISWVLVIFVVSCYPAVLLFALSSGFGGKEAAQPNAVSIEANHSNDLSETTNAKAISRPIESVLLLKSLILICIASEILNPLIGNNENLASGDSRLPMLDAGVTLVGINEEGLWIATSIASIMLLFVIEYVWITLEFSRLRSPASLHSFGESGFYFTHLQEQIQLNDNKLAGGNTTKADAYLRGKIRHLNLITFSSAFVRFWTPTLIVRINLGFDSLDHRSVTHAMLHGMKDAYKAKFLMGVSSYRIISFLTKSAVVLLILSSVSRATFSYPRIDTQIDGIGLDIFTEPTACSMLLNNSAQLKDVDTAGSFLSAVCQAIPGFQDGVLPILYTPIFKVFERQLSENDLSCRIEQNGNSLVIGFLLHDHCSLPMLIDGQYIQTQSYNFRLFHLLLLMLILWVSAPILSRISPFPYHRNLRKIERLADSLINTSAVSRRYGKWSMGRLIEGLAGKENEEEYTRSALDSRSVELAFMSLLNEIADPIVIGTPSLLLAHAPSPDIIFIFDELDKIGASGSPEVGKHGTDVETRFDERKRSKALHVLLSDMKRLISAAPAKFIFVGNRSLHDEYMADEGKREPLLTTIFDANLYLPSILMDHSQIDTAYDDRGIKETADQNSAMEENIREYLRGNYINARKYNDEQKHQWVSIRHLITGAVKKNGHLDVSHLESDEYDLKVLGWSIPHLHTEKQYCDADCLQCVISIQKEINASFINEFVGFLSFRSKGVPKKLGDIIAGYIRPTQRLLIRESSDIENRQDYRLLRQSRDSLMFDHANIYRIQFVNSLFKQLSDSFEIQLLDRDDKVTIDVLYLFDFLLKFHDRAFSWANLEHIDELAHIHKTPDLRRTISDVLDAGAGRYLHPVLNGMYSFRFRTEFAAEVRHLSKLNQAEMAAFNFTLDESQTLKAAYTGLINDSSQANEDIMVALGELHEYDKEYEKARGWYYSALFLNDREFASYIGSTVEIEDSLRNRLENSDFSATNAIDDSIQVAAGISTPPERVPYIKAILSDDITASENVSVHLPWATRRIRLLLQIGLTYEQTYDLERARSYYFSAHKLARAVLGYISNYIASNEVKKRDSAIWFTMACDHLEILHQPAFAAAWIAEKSIGSIDGSINIAAFEIEEHQKRFSEQILGFAGREGVDKPYLNIFANFKMVEAEAYNKAGDLCFNKGYKNLDDSNTDKRQFLELARDHYSQGLRLVSKFLLHRGSMAEIENNGRSWGFPSFVSQVLYSNIVDLAETNFALLSVDRLIYELKVKDKTYYFDDVDNLDYLGGEFLSIFRDSDTQSKDVIDQCGIVIQNKIFGYTAQDSTINSLTEKLNSIGLLNAWEESSAWTRTARAQESYGIRNSINSIILSICGANIASNAGLRRTAIDEFIMVLENIERTLKWLRMKCFSVEENREGVLLETSLCYAYLCFLSEITLYSIEQVSRLFHNEGAQEYEKLRTDERLLADAASQGCAILLSLSGIIACDDSCAGHDDLGNYALKIQNRLKKWFDFDEGFFLVDSNKVKPPSLDNYDMEMSHASLLHERLRRFARARLLYLNYRYSFPFLAALQRLKHLVDDVALSDGPYLWKKSATNNLESAGSTLVDGSQSADQTVEITQKNDRLIRRLNESKHWLNDLLKGAERFDNEHLMTNLELAESCYLMANVFGNEKWLSRSERFAMSAEQTVTMGSAYYRKMRNMFYLFDDFNDRKNHFKTASQMGGADLLKLFRIDR